MLNKLIDKLNNHFLKNNNLSNFDINNCIFDSLEYKIKLKKNDYNKTILFKNDIFEIIIIFWDEGSIAPKHNHPKNGCLLTVIEGELEETIFNKNIIKKNILTKNTHSYIHDKYGLHKIYSKNKSVSLHIYSPPNFYD